MKALTKRLRFPDTIVAFFATFVVITATPTSARPYAAGVRDLVADQIRARIEATRVDGITFGSEKVMSHRALPEFYESRDFRPAWIGERGPLIQALRLVDSVRQAYQQGLDPEDYHLTAIEELLQRVGPTVDNGGAKSDPADLAELDLFLTDAFLILGSHLLVGRVDPTTIDPEWFVDERRRADLVELLTKSLASNRVAEALSSLAPQEEGYSRLKEALARYRAIAAAGGWRDVPDGAKLEVGMHDPRVVALRERLMVTGDLARSSSEPTEDFDEALAEAVRSFQTRHGLEPDGVVGAATLAELNVPVEQRVHQLDLNLERWRWLPDRLGERYLLVNIASFDLEVFEDTQSVMSMKVVVGRPYRRTPVFSAEMTYLVLNPYWNVPPNMAVLDIVPAIRKEPDYLEQKNIKVFQGWGPDAQEIDPATVDWSQIGSGNLPYHFRQEPGPLNALGRVKFMFPNPHNIYLHDTPSRELFARPDRTFSSGCIRIERPIDLAVYLLRDDPGWSRDKILSAIETNVPQTVALPRSIPVHIEYWTSFSDATGTVNFRKDVYGRDALLDAALHEDPPAAHAAGAR
jgi:murein L,D-transpeptidase YcbB/YkuD